MEHKCVMVVDEQLPLGLVANTAAILGITLGKLAPQTVGEDVLDASGRRHLGIVTQPVPVLRAGPDRLRELRERLYGEEFDDLLVADFSDVAQGCKTYDEYIGKAAAVEEREHTYFGVLLYGDKKKVSRLTGNLPLLR